MQKICVVCGENCAGRPRVKDQSGRYRCKTCDEAGAAGQHQPPAGPAKERDPYALEDDAPLTGLPDDVRHPRACPVCSNSMPPDAKICVGCGFDPARGIQTSTLIEKTEGRDGRKHRCESCGYEITGIREPVCPECGERINLSRTRQHDRRIRAQVLEQEYLKPAVWLGAGFLVVSIAMAIRGAPLGFAWYAALLAVQLPFMWVGFWMCQKLFLGDIGTPLLNLLRLAGALALGDAVDEIIPLSLFFLTPGLIVFWAVLMDLFEIDLHQAILTGIIMAVLKIAGAIGVAMLLAEFLGIVL
jgi:predicted RNA-binding Zn-ribbon protein involved in translation (DUF1610 family)